MLDLFSYKLGKTQGGGSVDTEELTVDLSMADDNQVIVPSAVGKVMTQVTVKKPETLVPENVRSGIDVGGVVGSFLGDTEEKTVELNFANGTQTVEPSAAGKVLSKVNIPMPDTLLPENIAEGIDIAGIIGTLVGGANVKVAVGGTNVGTSGPQTVNHNLGVVPDLIVLAHQGTTTSTKPRYGGGFGMSSKFYDTYCAGRGAPNRTLIGINSNGQFHVDSDTIPMDKATSGTIYNVNATSFTVAQNILSCWFFAIAWLD